MTLQRGALPTLVGDSARGQTTGRRSDAFGAERTCARPPADKIRDRPLTTERMSVASERLPADAPACAGRALPPHTRPNAARRVRRSGVREPRLKGPDVKRPTIGTTPPRGSRYAIVS